MFKLIYYVPESHLESTKLAIFEAGAGGIGNYEHCAWQVLGTGQFKPVKGANPLLVNLIHWRKFLNGELKPLCLKKKLRQWLRHLKPVILMKNQLLSFYSSLI